MTEFTTGSEPDREVLMIVTISGASGSGKSTIAAGLYRKLGNASPVVSITTRTKRDNDNLGEYDYVSPFKFSLLNRLGSFLWTVFVHDEHYGTLKRSIRKALKRYDDVSVLILVPKCVTNLLEYAADRGSSDFVMSFYVLSPPPATLRKRLEGRGESELQIAKRIRECEKWDNEAHRSSMNNEIPYIFINNEGDVEDSVEQVLAEINNKYDHELI